MPRVTAERGAASTAAVVVERLMRELTKRPALGAGLERVFVTNAARDRDLAVLFVRILEQFNRLLLLQHQQRIEFLCDLQWQRERVSGCASDYRTSDTDLFATVVGYNDREGESLVLVLQLIGQVAQQDVGTLVPHPFLELLRRLVWHHLLSLSHGKTRGKR